MKKILLGTSALLAAAVLSTGAASAATSIVGNPDGAGTLTIKGNYNFYFGWAEQKSAYSQFSNLDVKTGGNLKFGYSNTLDNGLTVTVSTTLNTAGDHGSTYDSNTASVGSSTFGTFVAGQQTGFAAPLNHNAGSVSSAQVGFNDPDTYRWIRDPNGIYWTDTVETTYINDNRSNEIGYQTPSFGGFTGFFTYIPSLNTDGGLTPSTADRGSNTNSIFNNKAALEQFQVGATYDGTISGVTLGADIAYSSLFNKPTLAGSLKELQQGQAGFSIGYAGFTVAGGWHGSEWQYTDASATPGKAKSNVYDAGVGYAAGPYSVGLSWNHFEARGTVANLQYAGSVAGGSGDNDSGLGITGTHPKDDIVNLSGSYSIGTGVAVTGEIDYLDSQTDSSVNKDNSGVLVATGMTLSF